MIIEFFGEPGVGKTYLSKKMFPKRTLKKVNKISKIYYTSKFIITHSCSFLYLMKLCLNHPFKKMMISQVVFSITKYYIAKKKGYVLDENFIQLGFLLLLDNFKDEINNYLTKTPIAKKVFYINSSEKRSKKNMKKRGDDGVESILGKKNYLKVIKNFDIQDKENIIYGDFIIKKINN